MISPRCLSPVALSALIAAMPLCAAELRLKVRPDADGGTYVPVYATIQLPPDLAGVPPDQMAVTVQQRARPALPGQIVLRDAGQAELWWILPQARKGVATEWVAKLTRGASAYPSQFAWRDSPGAHLDLLYEGRPVTRYMCARDKSTPARAHETYKVYHHVFDPTGGHVITKGAGGRYTHHRGIFIGWNKLTFEGKRFDLWHMKNVEQAHQKMLATTAGPVLGRSTALIHWNDRDGEPILVEERTTTAYRQLPPAVLLLDFHTRLTAARGDVYLDGDPEHAGLQYRPHNEVAERAAAIAKEAKAARKGGAKPKPHPDRTIYLFHKQGIRPRKDHDLPWAAMSYVLGQQRYSVQHMDCPANPRPTIYSAYRDYGRFGAFFKHTIKSGDTLELRYRVLVLHRDMPPREDLALTYAAFVTPPAVEVRR